MSTPPVGKRFITIYVELAIKQELVALSYFLGRGGEYGDIVRSMLVKGLERKKASFTPKQEKDFALILGNVQIKDMLSPMTGVRKTSRYIKKKERGG